MTELERALLALGRDLDVPAGPDVTAAVRARLTAPARPGRRLRLLLAAAVAALIAIAVAFAVAPARSAILRFFHIRGAEVSIVDRLPRTRIDNTQLGRPGTLADAPFRVLLPHGERPDAVYLVPGGVWLRYGPASDPRLLVAEIRTGDPYFLKKVGATGTRVRYTSVGGEPAIWLEGARHELALPGGASRLAGNTLLWQRGALTLRLEGALSLERAQALALAFG